MLEVSVLTAMMKPFSGFIAVRRGEVGPLINKMVFFELQWCRQMVN